MYFNHFWPSTTDPFSAPFPPSISTVWTRALPIKCTNTQLLSLRPVALCLQHQKSSVYRIKGIPGHSTVCNACADFLYCPTQGFFFFMKVHPQYASMQNTHAMHIQATHTYYNLLKFIANIFYLKTIKDDSEIVFIHFLQNPFLLLLP